MDERKDRNTKAQPLSGAWWISDIERQPVIEFLEALPSDDVPILAPYEKTRPGFELVVAAACEPELCGEAFEDVGEGSFQVCLWDIWEREKDPADSDEEKQRINEMQRALGELDEDTRFIRLQTACMRRCFWTFPGNVDQILDGIGSGRINLDAGVSCEPPWSNSVLPVLRHRRQHPMAGSSITDLITDMRQPLVRTYIEILTWWLAVGDIECLKRELPDYAGLAETIYRRLGMPTKLRSLQVERLRSALSLWAFPTQDRRRWDWVNELQKDRTSAIQAGVGDEEDAIGGRIDRLHHGLCHHAFFRRVDHLIAHIGAGKPVTLPGAGKERERVLGAVTNYIHVLGSWLVRRTLEEAVGIWPSCAEIAPRVYDVLGEATPRKRWLVACLWKKLQDTDAHLGRGALDEDPERFALPPEALMV